MNSRRAAISRFSSSFRQKPESRHISTSSQIALEHSGEDVLIGNANIPAITTEPDILTRLRTLCLDLPEARETLTFNHPNFQVGKKAFAVLEDYGGGLGITFRATPLQQQALLQSGPRFSIPPYVGHHGWTALRLDESIDWDEISALLEEAYRLAAPKRLLKQLDAPR